MIQQTYVRTSYMNISDLDFLSTIVLHSNSMTIKVLGLELILVDIKVAMLV